MPQALTWQRRPRTGMNSLRGGRRGTWAGVMAPL
jgi:hypothetical protein